MYGASLWPMARTMLASIALLILSTGVVHAQEVPPESERVVASFMAALDNHDAARAASLLSTEAQVLTPSPVTGREAIAAWLGWHFPNDSAVEVSTYAATGQRVTWMTRLSQGSGSWSPRFILTWDEAVVVKGQITLWSSRGLADAMALSPHFRRARTLEPAPSAAQSSEAAFTHTALPIAFGGGIALAALCGAAYGFVRARRGGREPRQRHGGELLRSLQERLVGPRGTAYNARRAARGS